VAQRITTALQAFFLFAAWQQGAGDKRGHTIAQTYLLQQGITVFKAELFQQCLPVLLLDIITLQVELTQCLLQQTTSQLD
jgi:hypothetical protein